ncbi:hypothetical protein [Roseibium alexandrii]|uniref:hypothetical protein n=1 Tax=Roseibium alexandrii TaxID=388408 RepID=UPI003751B2DD
MLTVSQSSVYALRLRPCGAWVWGKIQRLSRHTYRWSIETVGRSETLRNGQTASFIAARSGLRGAWTTLFGAAP